MQGVWEDVFYKKIVPLLQWRKWAMIIWYCPFNDLDRLWINYIWDRTGFGFFASLRSMTKKEFVRSMET